MNYRFTLLLGVLLLAAITAFSVDTPPAMYGNNTSPEYYTESNTPVTLFPAFEINGGSIDGGGIAFPIKGLTISFTAGHHNDQDNLSIPNNPFLGINGSFDKSTGVLRLTGETSAQNYQTFVRGIKYFNDAAPGALSYDQRELTISFANGDYLESSGHFYEHVTGNYYWAAAKTAAAAKTYYGLQGYLCTVTSEEENNHILKIENDPNGTLWLGASDNDTEHTWKWLTGPENGDIFYQDGAVYDQSSYENWATGQPSGNEHYLQIFTDNVASEYTPGEWNDRSGGYQSGYIVEYGDMDGDPEITMTTTTTLDLVKPQPPVIKGNNDSPTYNTGEYNPVHVFPNFTVTDTEGSDIKGLTIHFSSGYQSNQDTLLFTNTSKITGYFEDTQGVLVLLGDASPAEYQAAMRSITYVNNAPLFSLIDGSQREFTISLANDNYFSQDLKLDNGHFYEYVNTPVEWIEAKAAASAKTYYGLKGYLATVTSENEKDFILSISDGTEQALWLGGSDEAIPDTWKWVTGPEDGTIFYQNGAVVSGKYENWSTGQPDDAGSVETSLQFFTSNGTWNDRQNGYTSGYIVEYGGMDGDPTINMTTTTTLKIDVVRPEAPGGIVDNLRVWFNANSGTSITNGNITSWEGQKPYGVNTTTVNDVAGDPSVVPNSANYNSVVSFDEDDAIRTTSRVPYTTYFNASSDRNTTFLVKKSTKGNVEAGYAYANGVTTERAGYFERAAGYQRSDYGKDKTILAGSTTMINKYIIARQDVQPGDFSLYLDGALERQIDKFSSLAGSSEGYLGFGANPDDFSFQSATDIAEYIIYASDLSPTEIKEVESYLALKYGISLNQTVATNYLASDGTVIWSATDNAGYATDIFGIGQDNASGLNQKVSRSVNNNNSPVLSTTANFLLSNADASRTALGEGNFMLMGHNNGTENSFTSSFNGGTNNRTDRVWKVDETGTVGEVYFAIPYAAVTFPSGGTPSVIISDDENFDDQDQVLPLTYNRTQGGYYARINPDDGDYIALAISEISVTLPTFYRTESIGGETTGITSYPSYSDFINNTNSTYTTFSQHWNFDDSFFADGVYFYRTNNAKTTVTRYPSLADLAAGTNGIVYNFTSGGSPQDWNDDDEFFASGDQFFRTASSNSLEKSTGLTVYNSFADLMTNTNGTFYAFTVNFNFEDQFFHDGEYFYRTNTHQSNNTQFGVARYASLSDLVASKTIDSPTFGPWSTNDDIFAVGITASFSVSKDTLTMAENAGKGEFTVVLDARPSTDVVLDIASDDTNEATVNKGQLTFTPDNWKVAQTITVTGVDDYIIRNDSAIVTVSVNTSSDNTFAALANQSVEIILEDDDVAGFTLSESTLTIDEDAGTASFTVVLNTQPISNVVFDVLSDDDNEAIVNNGTLTFTSGDWDTPQTITVTGVNDEIDREDDATITVSVDAASSDDTYDGEEDQTVAVTLTDDDEVPTVSTTDASSVISTSGVLGGNITDSGTSEVTETGVVYSSKNDTPEIGGTDVTKDVNGAVTGEYSETIESLAPNTTYYYQAYAISNAGISYGGVLSFKTKQTQVITFDELADKTYGDSDFDPEATASSNLTIAYSSSDTTVATIVDGNIHIVGAGSCTIYADQSGDDTYDAAIQVSQPLKVNKKPVTVTADAKSKVYGETDPALTYQITAGALVGDDALTGSLSRATGEDVGDYAISSTLANANYTITFESAALSITKKAITVTADAKSKVYGETDPALTYQITAGALVGSDALTGSLSRATGEDVGDYAISSTLVNANYTITFESAALSITKKAITVTADAKSKVYGETDPALTYQITAGALVGSDALTGSLSRATGEDVGDYAISSTLVNANYTITFESAALSITEKAITVTADAKSKVYGETDPALTYQITAGALVGDDALTGSLSRATGENVGTYAIAIGTLSAGSNYDLTFESKDFTITEKAITVTADAKSKVYGETEPALTYQITAGALVGDDALTGSLSRATGENVGTYAIAIGTLSAGSNYDLTFVSKDFTITEKAITVTADAKSKVYGETDPALTYQITVGALVGDDALTGSLSRATGEDIGDYAISSTLVNANYTITFESAALSITKKAITVTADAKSKVYGETEPALTYQITAGALVGDDALTGSLSRATGENVGTYAIAIGTLSAGSNYDLTFESKDFTITEKAITVTADAKSKVYGETEPALTYQITAGALVGDDALTGSLSRATGENVGTYAIAIGTLSAGSNYDLTFVSKDFTITEKAITVTADAKSKVYGETDPALTYQITVGALVGDDALTGSLSRATGEDVGDYAISSTLVNANYTITFESAALSITKKAITVTADAKSKVYGETEPALTYQITAGALVGDDALTGSLSRATGENVGTYAIAIGTLSAGSNYDLTFVSKDFTITEKAITVTADAKSKVYGETDPALTYQITAGALVGSDALTGSLSRATGEDVGDYAISSTLANANYTITFESAALSITEKAITVTADAKSKVYGETDPALTYQITAGALVGSDALTGSLSRDAGEDVGSYPITIGSLSAGTNYDFTFESSNFTINKKTITATAADKSKTYGEDNPELTFTYSGFVNGDNESDLTKAPVASTEATAASVAGNYKITVAGGVDENYDFTYNDATLTIEKATLTVTATAKDKSYDGTTTASITLSDDRVSGDMLTIDTTSAEFEDKNVGEGKTVTVAGIILSGDDANNYELSSATVSATADITPKNLTVSNAIAQNKIYDGTTDAVISGVVLKGVVLNDDVQLENETIGTFAQSTLGNDIEVTTSMTLSGVDAPNYLLVQPTGLKADITGKELTITGTFTVSDKEYDGTTNATVVTNNLELSGIEGEDDVTLSNVVIAFETASAGSELTVKVVSADLTGDAAAQYSLSLENSPTATASILLKEVTLSGANGITKTYDGNILLPSGTAAYGELNGILAEDETQVELTGNPLFDLADAGDRVIVQGSLRLTGSKADNYTFAWTDGTGEIEKATLTVVANNDAKFVTLEDEESYAGVSISGYVNGENSSVINQTGLTITRSNATENSAGEYTDVLEASGLTADNYVFNYLPGDYSIIPAEELLVEINDTSIAYSEVSEYGISSVRYLDSDGNTIKNLTENVRTLGNNQFSVDDGVGNVVSFTISEIDPEYNSQNNRLAVGAYQLEATAVSGSSNNFNNTIHVTGVLTVTTKEVEVQLVSGSEQKAFDGDANMDNLDMFTSDLVNGDDVELLGNGSFSQSEAGTDLAYSVTFVLQGTDKDNYHLKADVPITGNDGKIAQIELTVTDAKASNKVYDGTTTATITGATLNGAITGDDVTLANENTGAFVTDAVGNDIEILTSMTLAGADKDNYVLIQPSGLKASIEPQELTVANAVAQNKVYDGTTYATIVDATLSGVVADDEVLLENAESGTFKQDIVGTEIEVTTAMTISGADASNYYLIQPIGITADITTRELTVKDAVAESKIYDGTVNAVVSGAVLDGYISGDDVILANSTVGSFMQNSVGENIQVVTLMTLEGDDKDNYTLKQTSYLTANITAAELTLSGSFVVNNKEYDGTAIATMLENNLQFNGLASGDIVSLDSIILAFETSNAGTGLEVYITGGKITGSDASKYSFSLNGAPVTSASINKKELTVTADNKTKEYDGSGYSSFTVSYSGFIDGEDETNLSGALSFAGTATTAINAGTDYTITPGGLSSENYAIVYVDGYLDIQKVDQTITFNPISQQILSNSSFELSAVASSGLTVEYSSSDESIATVSGKIVTFINSGTCTIYANQPGNVNYNAAEQVLQTLTIIPYISGDSNHDGKITPPEIAGDSNEDGQINDGEVAGDTNGDGQIGDDEVAGDTNGDGQINDDEVAGDNNGDGKITAPEVAGDTDGNGQIDDDEVAGDNNGDGKITAPEVAGDTDGNGQINDDEVAGDNNGDGQITEPEVAGDTDGNGQINDDEVAGDNNGDGKITAPEVAGDTDGNGQINDDEVAGDNNGDGQITEPEVAGDTDGNGQINDDEVAGDNNGDGKITAPEVAGDTDGNGQINDDEVAGDNNGDGKITAPEVAGDTDGNGQINDDEVAGDNNGDGKITAPEVAGDTDGNGQIDDDEVAGDNNGDGQITAPEVAGDTDGNGQIDDDEVAGDNNGDGQITAPEVAGDTDGNGQIDDDEVAGDNNGDGQITAPEVAGDTDGNGQIDDDEVAGDNNGDGQITEPEVAGDTDGNGQINDDEVAGDNNGDGQITAPEVAGDTDGNGQINDDEVAGDNNGDGQITEPEVAGDTDGNGQINDDEVAGDNNGDGKITAPEVAGDTDGNGQIDDDEVAGDNNGDGQITEPEVAGDTDGNGQINDDEVAGDNNGDGQITAPEVAGDTDGNGQINDDEVAGDNNGDGQITEPEVAGDTDGNGQINDDEVAGDNNGDGKITAPEVAGDTDGNGQINDDEVAGDNNGDGKITAPEVAGDTDGNGQINDDEVAGDNNGDGQITAPEVAGDTDGNGQIDDDEVAGDNNGDGQIAGDNNGDGQITAPEVAGDTDGNGQIDDDEVAGDNNGDGQITAPEVAGDTDGNGQIGEGEVAEWTIADISVLRINDEVFENPDDNIYYLIDCGATLDYVSISFELDSYASSSHLASFEMPVPTPGIYKEDIKVVSADSTQTRTYHIVVEKRFDYNDIVVKKYNNVLLVNNNPETNGGYHFSAFSWYKDGVLVGTDQYYSAGDDISDQLDLDAQYSVEMETEDGDLLQTCMFNVSYSEVFSLQVAPNPVKSGDIINVATKYSPEMLGNMNIIVKNISGGTVLQTRSRSNANHIVLPSSLAPGTYIVTTVAGGVELSAKIIVQ